MDNQQARVDTFTNWPRRKPREPLNNFRPFAEAGFYYPASSAERESDRLQCAYCPLSLAGWQDQCNPFLMHAINFPTCVNLMVHKGRAWIVLHTPINRTENRVINVGAGSNALSPLLHDGGHEHQPKALFITERVGQIYKTPKGVAFKEPLRHDFSDFEKRFDSLNKFQKIRSEFSHQEFADAGFFWPGNGNSLLCYYCCSRSKDIDKVAANEDPFEMHANMNQACFHLILEKGENFIHYVTSDHTDRFPVEEENLNTGF